MDLTSRMERAAELLAKGGADQWEVMALASRGLEIAVRGEAVDKYQKSASEGLALRVVKDGRLGFAYTIGGDGDSLAAAADQALASALASDLVQEAGLAAPAAPPAELEIFDPELAAEPEEAKRARALAVAEAARRADPSVVHVHPAGVDESIDEVRLMTSAGLAVSYRATTVSAGAVAVAARDGEQEMAGEQDARRFLQDLDPEEVGRQAGIKAAAFLGAGPVADGRYDLVLEPEVAAEFLSLLSHSLKGDTVAKGRSLLASRLGEKALSPAVSIVDDGLLPRGLGTAPVDDEGTAQARTVLVDRGVVEGFVYDRLWAWRQGAKSTGNAVRAGLKSPPGVGFCNLHILPGSKDLGGLRAGLSRGLVISEVMGAHTANPVSGEFSLGASGHLVENGRVTRPVKSIALAGQVVELFASVREAGSDLRFFGRTGSPSLLVEGVSVSGG